MNAELSCYNTENHGFRGSVEVSPKLTLHKFVQRYFNGLGMKGRYLLPTECVNEIRDACVKAMKDPTAGNLSKLELFDECDCRLHDIDRCLESVYQISRLMYRSPAGRCTYYYEAD